MRNEEKLSVIGCGKIKSLKMGACVRNNHESFNKRESFVQRHRSLIDASISIINLKE